jgi:LmbE family N-acetylglucosaminyl deacetylase
MALRDAGWTVVNLACGLGRPEQRTRREAELREACRLAGFELRMPASSSGQAGERASTRARLTALVVEALAECGPQIVVSPGAGDRHPAHRIARDAVHDALRGAGREAARWWMWALWGSLPQPTLGTTFDSSRLEEILTALGAHGGELARNDYRRLVRSRAEMHASLAPELLFGFGLPGGAGEEYVELLTEAALVDGRWLLGRSRWLDPVAPLGPLTREEATVGGF